MIAGRGLFAVRNSIDSSSIYFQKSPEDEPKRVESKFAPSARSTRSCEVLTALTSEHRELISTHSLPDYNKLKNATFLYPDEPKSHWDVVTINVSGKIYQTRLNTLQRFPETVLGNPIKRHKLWDNKRKEYFLDHHRPSFEGIFQFYQTGHLKRPYHVHAETFLEGLQMMEFNENVIIRYKEKENLGPIDSKPARMPRRRIQRFIWRLFEYPDSSTYAKVIGIVSVLFIVTSIISFCLETIPSYSTLQCRNDTDNRLVQNFENPFFIIETICIFWFSIEFLFRVGSCPDKLDFAKNLLNILDLVIIIPYYIGLIVSLISNECPEGKKGSPLIFLRVLRIFRVFKLSKHFEGLLVLGMTLKASLREIGLFIFFVCVGATIFAGAIYYAESSTVESQIQSIPEGM